MSDRVRQGAGIVLMLGGILLCLIPAFRPVTGEEIRYRSGTVQEWGISRIETERNGTVAVNCANTEELTVLPWIGETLAQMIIAEQNENGPFYYAEDLQSVRGIGPKTLERFRNMIDLSQGESGE